MFAGEHVNAQHKLAQREKNVLLSTSFFQFRFRALLERRVFFQRTHMNQFFFYRKEQKIKGCLHFKGNHSSNFRRTWAVTWRHLNFWMLQIKMRGTWTFECSKSKCEVPVPPQIDELTLTLAQNITGKKALFSSPWKPKSFQDFPSHRILWHMHETLNINENKN